MHRGVVQVGWAFLENDDPDSAIRDFDRAIQLNPDYALAYCQRGRAHMKMRDYYRAIDDATTAIRLRPDLGQAYLCRGIAYLGDDRFDRALADLAEAVKIDPALESQARAPRAEACRNQGIGYLDSRQWGKAVASLEETRSTFRSDLAGEISPTGGSVPRARIDYGNRGKFEEAVRDLNRALKLDKDNAQTHRLSGLTCRKMAQVCHDRGLTADEKEQWECAIRYLGRAIQLAPELTYAIASSVRGGSA